MQHHTIDHTLTFTQWLLIYHILLTLTILTQPPEGEDTLKYFFQSISWNTYFTMFHCVNYREMVMIYFLRPFMKYENSENRFSEFSLSWKTFLLNLFSCMINSFVINDVCKNLNQNVNIKVKSKHKVVFRTLYWKNWKIDLSSFLRIMNEKDFNFDAVTRFRAY